MYIAPLPYPLLQGDEERVVIKSLAYLGRVEMVYTT